VNSSVLTSIDYIGNLGRLLERLQLTIEYTFYFGNYDYHHDHYTHFWLCRLSLLIRFFFTAISGICSMNRSGKIPAYRLAPEIWSRFGSQVHKANTKCGAHSSAYVFYPVALKHGLGHMNSISLFVLF
jgi:hypothetical protein